uniref:Secreted protein n=1 Tax=Cacopsylla melanoneura TaxID=428564 RepID=A0A8D8Z5Y2_9HEMI
MVSKELSFQMTLMAPAIILTAFICSDAEKYDYVVVLKLEHQFPLADLCVNGKTDTCTGLSLDQATSVCGKEYNTYKKDTHYTNITLVKCNGNTCHAEIATNDTLYHAGLDCTQKGTDAACSCIVYRRVNVE